MLLSFDVESLSNNVMLEYFSCAVRAFVSNPLRCYRCQACGQVATVCRREGPRREKSAEGHEYVVLEKEAGCVNCRDAHCAGDQKCPV